MRIDVDQFLTSAVDCMGNPSSFFGYQSCSQGLLSISRMWKREGPRNDIVKEICRSPISIEKGVIHFSVGSRSPSQEKKLSLRSEKRKTILAVDHFRYIKIQLGSEA